MTIASYSIAVHATIMILVICASGDLSVNFTMAIYIGAPLTKIPASNGAAQTKLK